MIKSDEYHEVPFQLLLVKYGARKLYLFGGDFSDKQLETILNVASENGLHMIPVEDDDNRHIYWIYTHLDHLPNVDDETEIGSLLGFMEPGGDYSNQQRHRKKLSISVIDANKSLVASITDEMILDADQKEIEEFAQQKIDTFDSVMIRLELPYRFVYTITQDHGTLRREQALRDEDMEFLLTNEQQYIREFNDFLDLFHPLSLLFSHVIHHPRAFRRYLPVFLYVYQIINQEILQDKRQGEQIEHINEYLVNLMVHH